MSDWKDVVGTVAPGLAAALLGPLAGVATGTICQALGLAEADEEQARAALDRATPEQLAALKRAELEFMAQMKKLDVDLAAINAADRNSARQRESNTGDVWTPRLLAVVTLGMFGFCLYFALSGKMQGLSDVALAIASGVIGYASAKADTVIGYYFGSSAQSVASQSGQKLLHKGQSHG